jgi:hypothetical protein
MIRPNDTVLHRPSGEQWVVCGVDPERDELIPCGYPFPTLARLSDCELVEEHYSRTGQPEEYKEVLRAQALFRFVEK